VECDERVISVPVDISGHYLIVLCIPSIFQIVIKTDSTDSSLEVEPNYYVCVRVWKIYDITASWH
jgi:hypothetical protein